MEDIFTLLQERGTDFSRRQRAISKYIQENCDSAAFLTAERLAEIVGVSESTVVRFATELGYEGYPAMRRALQEVLRSKLIAERNSDREDSSEALKALRAGIKNDVSSLRQLSSDNNREVFSETAESLCTAGRVYVAGAYALSALAEYLRRRLSAFRENACTADFYLGSEELKHMSAGDLLIILQSEDTAVSDTLLRDYAAGRGAKIISIGSPGGISSFISAETPAAMMCIICALADAAEKLYCGGIKSERKEEKADD